jgi:hypothetical protein
MSTNDEQYEILPSSELLSRMIKLSKNYPTFVTLTTTQEWFGLPRAGELIFVAVPVVCWGCMIYFSWRFEIHLVCSPYCTFSLGICKTIIN